jgi:hypothetical protein
MIAEFDTRLFEAVHRLLQLSNLVAGGRDPRRFENVHKHIVDCVDIARYRQYLADCGWSGVGGFDQGGQRLFEIALDGVDIRACLLAH